MMISGIHLISGKHKFQFLLLLLILGFTYDLKSNDQMLFRSASAGFCGVIEETGTYQGNSDKFFALSRDTVPKADDIQWLPASSDQFTVNGLWWFRENGGKYYRLPERANSIAQINPLALRYSKHPAGARVRFKTDSPTLSLKVDHGGDSFSWKELSIMAMAGIELYEGNPEHMVFKGISKPVSGKAPYNVDFKLSSSKELREYTLYLPMYAMLQKLDVALEPGARLEPPTPLALSKPVVFYGSSFIQGGCASRPSMNLPALIGRKLGVDIINLGFAGDGTYEFEMADLMAEIDAACFVLGPILNDPNLMGKNYQQFVTRLRQLRPDCPIIMMTRLHTLGQAEPFGVNALVKKVFDGMKKSGDRNVHYFDSFKLYRDGSFHPTVEGLHPSDLGFSMISDALAPKLAKVLGLPAKKVK